MRPGSVGAEFAPPSCPGLRPRPSQAISCRRAAHLRLSRHLRQMSRLPLRARSALRVPGESWPGAACEGRSRQSSSFPAPMSFAAPGRSSLSFDALPATWRETIGAGRGGCPERSSQPLPRCRADIPRSATGRVLSPKPVDGRTADNRNHRATACEPGTRGRTLRFGTSARIRGDSLDMPCPPRHSTREVE